ncbi:MAG TPA: phosphoribosyltransferase family protein [Salinimicrobium sp.]|nr:phosphoribosyltransferase family protein [Salinimicrobium sp.]
MDKPAVLILDQMEIDHKIKRIAYQILESNVDQDSIILAGIEKNGFQLAEKLKKELIEISELEVDLCRVKIDKKNPLNQIETSIPLKEFTGRSIVLVDDVLNSGTTLIYGVRYFLDVPLKQFKTAVLVDRSHKKYPVKADFKGISLSTSLSETVQVRFSSSGDRVELL